VDRDRQPHLITFFTDEPIVAGSPATLSESASHHVRVRRLAVGDAIRLTDGAGHVGVGTIATITRGAVAIDITDLSFVTPSAPVHLRAPVADRDRMLWLAEKTAELGIASWQAVRFQRSASVSPRGEGPAFSAKLRARMIGALEQSGGAWLPSMLPDVPPQDLAVAPGELGILLDRDGVPLPSLIGLPSTAGAVILLGPEGGLESSEIEHLAAAGWQRASLAETTLRFETAGVAAVAVCRALAGVGAITRGKTNG
jgi:16S rRNA (uracil1498-N3)-methyltransferase